MSVGSNKLYFTYDASGAPMAVTYNGTNYYYATNLQGDVVGIVNQSGNLLVSYTYDAWGNVLTTTGSSANTLGKYNPLRYHGYVYDTESGLYYLQSRYYDPEVGRFINADVVYDTDAGLQGYNIFIYCGNNPVDRIDISGADSLDIIDGNKEDEPELEGGSGSNGKGAPNPNGIRASSSTSGTGNSCGNSSHSIPRDGSYMNSTDILDAAQNFLGQGYTEASPGRFTSSGGTYQFRMLESDLTTVNNHAGAPHVNFEIWIPDPLREGRMKLVDNHHVFIIDAY